MTTAFEVETIFRIVNRASPTITAILRQIRELNAAIEKARANMAQLSLAPASLTTAVGETRALAAAWKDVAAQSTLAQRQLTSATAAASRVAGGGAAAGGGGGGRARLGGRLGIGGAAHVRGPGVAVPGGGHVNFRGGAAAAAGLIGFGAFEAAELEDAVFQLIYHAGLEQNDANRGKFRKILQNSMVESGFGLKDIAESAKQEIRMFQGTPGGGGIDVLPEMLRAATIEARLKGTTPKESMESLIGLAHMTKQYSPDEIKKLAPAFAFLSTANPASLSSIERAAGYAVPILQSGLEIDPLQTLLLGTALTRAGATNTKSGTWLRELAIRSMPGTSLMSKIAFKKHEAALKELGLVDKNDKPTWFTGGKPDLLKLLDVGGANAAKIPLERRAGLERQLFGAQGAGAFALLADPAVREQVQNLQKDMNSPEFKNRYAGFVQAYQEGSTVQNARTAIQEFNVTMADLGAHVLPSVNAALKDFKGVLETLRGMVPGANKDGSIVGQRALEGALGGAALGAVAGPFGAVGGGTIGGVLGTAEGVLEQYSKAKGKEQDRKETEEFSKSLREQGETGTAGQPSKAQLPPISFSLNIDGRALAKAVSEQMESLTRYETHPTDFNGAGQFP